jgi:hypothetical protein
MEQLIAQDVFTDGTLTMLGGYLLLILAFIGILVVGRWIASRIRSVIRGGFDRPELDRTLTALGGSSVNWEVRIWAAPDDYFRLKQELSRQVKYHLDEAEIGIPYPQLDVHIQNGAAENGSENGS